MNPHEQIQNRMIYLERSLEAGETNPLDALLEMRKEREQLENSLAIIKETESKFYDDFQREAEKSQNEYKGFKFEFRNGRKTYSFNGIPEWQAAEKSKKEIEAKYKAVLEAKIRGSQFANVSEEGEELPLPEISYGKGSLIVKPLK
ncbi:MAG TPA: hypothetical protein VFM82_02745 [Flavobacteriaceae bacterium]|nr:hypothetical protein [Flavobacteriaceae bacterium]